MNVLWFLFSFLFLLASPSQTLAQDPFQNLQDQVLYDLGPQCAFSNLDEVRAMEASQTDPDLKMSFDEFLSQVEQSHLLSESLFHNPDAPENAKTEITSIRDWTQYYLSSGRLETRETCFLNAKEIFSLFYYTGAGYRPLNKTLRTQDPTLLKSFQILIKHLNSALDKLQPYQGYVKRGERLKAGMTDKDVLRTYPLGEMITHATYTSTTIAKPFEGEVQFVLKVHNQCRYIADFSLVEQKTADGLSLVQEEEVLCKPGTRFRVVSHDLVPGNRHQIVMEEISD
jgi:hypothetical protein